MGGLREENIEAFHNIGKQGKVLILIYNDYKMILFRQQNSQHSLQCKAEGLEAVADDGKM